MQCAECQVPSACYTSTPPSMCGFVGASVCGCVGASVCGCVHAYKMCLTSSYDKKRGKQW